MYSVIEFDKNRECAIVPLTWLEEDQKVCLWPNNIKNEAIIQDYVTSNKASPWRKYKIKKVHFLSGNVILFIKWPEENLI